MYLLGGNDESFDASRGVGEAELVHPSSTFRERQPRKRLPTGNVRSKCTFYPPQETNPRDAFPAIRVKRRWKGTNPPGPSGLTLPKTYRVVRRRNTGRHRRWRFQAARYLAPWIRNSREAFPLNCVSNVWKGTNPPGPSGLTLPKTNRVVRR